MDLYITPEILTKVIEQLSDREKSLLFLRSRRVGNRTGSAYYSRCSHSGFSRLSNKLKRKIALLLFVERYRDVLIEELKIQLYDSPKSYQVVHALLCNPVGSSADIGKVLGKSSGYVREMTSSVLKKFPTMSETVQVLGQLLDGGLWGRFEKKALAVPVPPLLTRICIPVQDTEMSADELFEEQGEDTDDVGDE